jgi:hypothetical protein
MPGRDQIKDVIIRLNFLRVSCRRRMWSWYCALDTACVNNHCIPGLKNAFFAPFRQGSG